jgi:uncharacterized repeat protein (TIGR03803 family)
MLHRSFFLVSKKTTTVAVAVLMFAAASTSAQTFTTLASFDGTQSGTPQASLVQAVDGNLYGTNYGAGSYPYGSIFKITPLGAVTTDYYFNDGVNPRGMVLATNGSLYGTTFTGGKYGAGTAFRFDVSTGVVTTFYNFCSQPACADGWFPNGIVEASDGNFYGTTRNSQVNGAEPGVIFRLTSSGVLTPLYTFCQETGCFDGWNPFSGGVQDYDGNFYGTTWVGGTGDVGTVYKVTLGGVFTSLHSFSGADGGLAGGLVPAAGGALFGTTESYGTNSGGTLFKITVGGALTTLYNFCAKTGCVDGSAPSFYSALIQATDGNFYGTTQAGGRGNHGTIFKITPAGALSTLHSFSGSDGAAPVAGLIQTTNGNLYGTTSIGGSGGAGTVFELTTGLPAFAKTIPIAGHAGVHVIILGNNLAGTTAVTFNGASAAFTVLSASAIQAIVPAGATTGVVKVTTTSGILTSNVVFRVI